MDMQMNNLKERAVKIALQILSFASLAFLAGIAITLFIASFKALKDINQIKFIFSIDWAPYYEPGQYGILSLIISSFIIGIVSTLIAAPLGIGTALFLYELAGNRARKILKPAIEILAGVSSIIFGFFAMTVLAPMLQETFDLPSGLCVLTASIMLAVMSIPIITSMTEDALSFVPLSFKEASFALGANRWQTLKNVIVPAAASGIITSIILAVGRIVGETMVVLMAAGGASAIPKSIFDPARPMTSTIAAEMGEAAFGSLHFSALFEIGLILFLMTFVLNYAAEKLGAKYRLKLGQNR
jgi:phosphate transport system permease protein